MRGLDLADGPYGMRAPGSASRPAFMRHMYEYGTTSAQVAHVQGRALASHAAANPKALLKDAGDGGGGPRARAGWCKPLHLLDCCLETDNATALVVTSAERARDARHPPVYIMAAAGRVNKARPDYLYQRALHDGWRATTPGSSCSRPAGIGPEDVDVTGAYDAFTFTAMLQLEEFGFCEKGEGGALRVERHHRARRPAAEQHRGGHLCEGYTHGMSMVIENVRQLRGHGRRLLPAGWRGRRTRYDYRPGRCRQVRDARITMNIGWACRRPAAPSSSGAACLTVVYRGMELNVPGDRLGVARLLQGRAGRAGS